LALRRRYLPAQRSLQPPHLGLAAFDHLFLPNQMGASESHLGAPYQAPVLPGKNSIQAVMELV
jgi:hypothetical protein